METIWGNNNEKFGKLKEITFASFRFVSFRFVPKNTIDLRSITCYILWVLHRIFYLYKIRATCSARIHFDSFIVHVFFFIFFSYSTWNLDLYYVCIKKCSIYVYLKFPFIFMFRLYNYLCRANIWFTFCFRFRISLFSFLFFTKYSNYLS